MHGNVTLWTNTEFEKYRGRELSGSDEMCRHYRSMTSLWSNRGRIRSEHQHAVDWTNCTRLHTLLIVLYTAPIVVGATWEKSPSRTGLRSVFASEWSVLRALIWSLINLGHFQLSISTVRVHVPRRGWRKASSHHCRLTVVHTQSHIHSCGRT